MVSHRLAALLQSIRSSRRATLRVLGGATLAPVVAPIATSARKHKRKHKACARAGQTTSRKRKRCCPGLQKDAKGRCVCIPAACEPYACGERPDGCGGITACGACVGDAICVDGTCRPCTVTCPPGATDCAAALETTLAAGGTVYVCPGTYEGPILIAQSVTVIGAGQGLDPSRDTILKGISSQRALRITGPAVTTATLRNLRVTGGNGGIFLEAGHIASLVDCTVTGNTATGSSGFGAGIVMSEASRLSLAGCTISRNEASNDGGGIRNYQGRVTITNSVISGNASLSSGGGIDTTDGALTLDAASRITGNRSRVELPDSGGGIHATGATVTLASSENVTGNTPDNCGGTPIALCVD